LGEISISFDHIKDKEKVCELSVVIYADSFFYGLWDDDDRLVKADSGHITELNAVYNEQVSSYDLKIARIMSTLKPFVHIPGAEYEEKYFDHYFSGIYQLDKVDSTGRESDTFLREDIRTLHYMDNEFIMNDGLTQFPVKTAHISTALANYAYLIESDYISYLAHNTLHISSSTQSKFQFYNQFECYHKKDYLYFYMLTLNALKLDPKKEIVNIGGLLTNDSPIYELLHAYIGDIRLRDNDVKIDEVNAEEKQFYFDLYLCKSCV